MPERRQLGGVEAIGEEALDFGEMVLAGRLEATGAVGGQLRIGDPAVVRARDPLDQAGALEPGEQAGDPALGDQQPLREVHPAQATLIGQPELKQHLVLVEAEPVAVTHREVQLTGDRRVGAEKVEPGLAAPGAPPQGGFSVTCLIAQVY